MGISIIKKTSTVNTTALANRTIKYIVLHYTAGITSKKGTAEATASWFANSSAKASADFICDDETIIQFNPDIANRYCWHCGGSKYNTKGGSLYGIAKNANSIGIEICSTNSTGKVTNPNDGCWGYTDAVLEKAWELVKYLMETYGIDADHVIRHYDVNGKPCPGIIGWNEDTGDISKWQAFKKKLSGTAFNNDKIPTSTLPEVPFAVKVLINDLNYRSEGSMNAEVLGQTGKGTFTIVKVNSEGWGKLKSGAGWIYLLNQSYCTIADDRQTTSTVASDESFMVKVEISNLNIRSGPGMNHPRTGKYTGKGTFPIVEVSTGKGSTAGWGRLKSGAGWISLDFVTRLN